MSRPQPTTDERERWSWFQEVGCLPCRKEERMGVPADVAHETQGGRRTGHEFTFPGCAWHHRGHPPEGMDGAMATAFYGPSFAISKRDFQAAYGTERQLAEETDRIIAELRLRRVG